MARALNPEFVPLFRARSDLVVPREHYDSELLALHLDIIRGDEFRHEVEALAGSGLARVRDEPRLHERWQSARTRTSWLFRTVTLLSLLP